MRRKNEGVFTPLWRKYAASRPADRQLQESGGPDGGRRPGPLVGTTRPRARKANKGTRDRTNRRAIKQVRRGPRGRDLLTVSAQIEGTNLLLQEEGAGSLDLLTLAGFCYKP